MRKVRLAALAVAVAITVFAGSALPPVPCANAQANAVDAAAIGAATVASEAEGTVSGEMMTMRKVEPGSYMVRTVWQDAPLTKVRVEWRRQIDDAVPALVGDTIRIGTANFRPASGTYYLTAEWRADGDFARPRKPGDRFAWYGGNPRLVSSEASEVITLTLEEVPPLPASTASPTGTGIFGRVTRNGVPVADAGVYAYAKTGSGFKSDDFQATVRTNAKGEFALELPPDRYFLLARLRADKSEGIGPLHKGDLLGYDPRNPIVVTQGRSVASAIPMARLRQIKSRAESSAFPPGTIVGRIVDREGRPVPGAYAALYQNPKMIGRPAFMSERVGADGRFSLSVPIPGSYFIGARSGYGTPAAGAWFGVWGGSADHSLPIKMGEVRAGVEIVVDRLLQKMGPIGNP